MIGNRDKELDDLLGATRRFIEDEFDNSHGELMGLYEAHRDYMESELDLESLIDEIESTIDDGDQFEATALEDAYDTYKASL